MEKAESTKTMLYRLIADRGTVGKAELQGVSGLNSSKLTRSLDEMTIERIIEEVGFGPSSGGRRPILYRINANYRYCIGIEISRLYSTLGLFDMQMNPKSLIRWRMDEAMTPKALVAYVASVIRTLLRDHQIEASELLGIGIGAVGPLDRSKGIILTPLHFLAKGWSHVPICELLEEATGLRAYLENGANTALLGEHWSIRDEQVEHALYVHAGVSLRSAMMSYGSIVHGGFDREDAIGQMIIHMDGPRLHASSNYGALEAYSSILAMEGQARTQAKTGGIDLHRRYAIQPEQLNYDVLLRALQDEDSFVQQLFHQSATSFGVGLANLINIFHPQLVILGGALINSKSDFYQTALDVATKNTYYSTAYKPRFSKGQLKEDAVVTGAALSVRNLMTI